MVGGETKSEREGGGGATSRKSVGGGQAGAAGESVCEDSCTHQRSLIFFYLFIFLPFPGTGEVSADERSGGRCAAAR